MKPRLEIVSAQKRSTAVPVVLDVAQVSQRFTVSGSKEITVLQDIGFTVRRVLVIH